MSKKQIVKPIWLSFLQLSTTQLTGLQGLILTGKLQSEKNIPKELHKKLTPEESSFLVEKTLQVLGRPSAILESLEDLSAAAPKQVKALRLWQERLFLKGFALSRLGRSHEASKYFQLLPDLFQPRIQIENALILLNSGDFIAAEKLFKLAFEDSENLSDLYSRCTLLGGLSLSLIQQGSFREAELCLKKRKHLLKSAPSPTLNFGTRLYEILLLLEKNEFVQATVLLNGSLDESSEVSINSFFLRHLKLRLHLARNELTEAASILTSLKKLVKSQTIPEGVLDFRLEEIEWLLRSKKATEALKVIAKLKTETRVKQDLYLNFRLSLLSAQAHYQSGETKIAFQEATEAIQQGETRHYWPGLTWALFHGAGISLAAGHPVQAKLYLHRGERLSSELRLRARFACFAYMTEVMERSQNSGHALLSLVQRQDIGAEMEYYLDSYNLLSEAALKVSSRQGQEVLAEPELRRRLFKEPGFFWFQKEEVLLANLGEPPMKLADLSKKPNLLSAFRLFWNGFQNQDPGFSLKELHQTRLPSTYREELHAGATKMLITRLRDILQACGLKIFYNRDTGLYSLQSSLPPFTLLSQTNEDGNDVGKTAKKSNREEELLSRIAMEPFVPTRVLCHEFGVSRQALHPFLNKLMNHQKIRLVKRGPISGYIFLKKI